MTSSASLTTAPSMQPPETEPTISPFSLIAELAADRTRGRAPRADHGRQGYPMPGVLPGLELFEDLVVLVHSALPNSSKMCRLWPRQRFCPADAPVKPRAAAVRVG